MLVLLPYLLEVPISLSLRNPTRSSFGMSNSIASHMGFRKSRRDQGYSVFG
jgi:hypothetical protein